MATRLKLLKMKNSMFIHIVWLFAGYLSHAQTQISSTDPSTGLLALEGYTQTIYHSPGNDERARNIAKSMETAGNFFQEAIGFTPNIELYILAPKHWKAIAAIPFKEVYGFPHNIDMVRLAIATEDNDFWRSFLPTMDGLPPNIAIDVKKTYGKSDGSLSMMPFFDLLAIHEMGHSYTSQAGLKMQRHWMGELFVNIMLHTYVAEKQPHLLSVLEILPNISIAGGSAEYEHKSLEDFEKLYPTMGISPKNYGWYQFKLHAAAKDIYNEGGKEVLSNLWKSLKAHQEPMNDDEFMLMLQKEVHPSVADVFLSWKR